jgi:hypothetical protein
MATFLRDQRLAWYHLIAIQEPWLNKFQDTTHHPTKDIFHLIYPLMVEGVQVGVCFFVNKSLDIKAWEAKILAPNHIV